MRDNSLRKTCENQSDVILMTTLLY